MLRPLILRRASRAAVWLQVSTATRTLLRSAALLACLATFSASCGKVASRGTQLGGESHFLGGCAEGCGELSCISGICTRPCAELSACSDLNPAASCRFDMGAGAPQGFCDVACGDGAACPGSAGSCEAGYCRAPSPVWEAAVADAGPASLAAAADAGGPAELPLAELPLTAGGLPLKCATSTTLYEGFRITSQRELETLEGCEEIDPCPWQADGYCDACPAANGDAYGWGTLPCALQLCRPGLMPRTAARSSHLGNNSVVPERRPGPAQHDRPALRGRALPAAN
jgi:hypothetical protein